MSENPKLTLYAARYGTDDGSILLPFTSPTLYSATPSKRARGDENSNNPLIDC